MLVEISFTTDKQSPLVKLFVGHPFGLSEKRKWQSFECKKEKFASTPQKQIINQHTERESIRGGLEAEAEEKLVR